MRTLILALFLALTASCSSSAGPGAAADAGPVTQDLVIDEGTFTVPPGQEVVYCVRIPMPADFQGRDLALVGWDSDVTAPMHHYFMFYDTNSTPGTAPVPCKGTDGSIPASSAGPDQFSTGTLIFVAGKGTTSHTENEGYGAVLARNGTFVTNHHVINSGSQPITVGAKFTLKVAGAADVAHPTRALSCETVDINLPPGASDVTATCLAPFDLDVVSFSSHAHQDLVKFETRMYDGTTTQPDVLYTSTDWESPTVTDLTTPFHLAKGQGLTFTCHYDNNTGANIGFGLTATTEMCASMNTYAYPVDQTHQVPPMLGATTLSNSQLVTAQDKAGALIPLF
jgi:hypothetical protein